MAQKDPVRVLKLVPLRFFDSGGESRSGFTIIELIVVVGIMGLMLTLFLVNLTGNRDDRNLLLAQNQLVTNIRNAQAYTLSARQVAPNQNGQFFVIKIDNSTPNQYSLQSIYNITSTPVLVANMETYQFPAGVRLAAANPIVVSSRTASPATISASCGLIAFKAPYARVYLSSETDGTCHFTSVTNVGDDYNNLITYVGNVVNAPVSADSVAVITLTNATATRSRKVMVRGVTGVVCPTQDGTTCSSN